MKKIPFAGIELTSQSVRGYMIPLIYNILHDRARQTFGVGFYTAINMTIDIAINTATAAD